MHLAVASGGFQDTADLTLFCGEVDEQAIQFGGYCICSACRRKLSAL